MGQAKPLVSVVIPTRNRPQLVVRAVRSVLSQTLRELEVIVVLDCPDEPTMKALGTINDLRLRIERLPQPVAPGAARNAGVEAGRGAWVAFLDDDDEWLPDKLERQLHVVEQSSWRYPIVSCRLIARRAEAEFVWPRRYPHANEPISEYLFRRTSCFWGEGLVPASTVFTSRELAQRIPFSKKLRRQEDNHWILEAATVDGVRVEFVASPQPLVVRHIEDDRERISNRTDWRYNLAWIQANRHLVTVRAYAGFLLGDVSLNAARANQWDAFVPLLREAFRHGEPRAFDVLLYLAAWLVPDRLQRRLAASYARRAR